jgi:hypothetical protein
MTEAVMRVQRAKFEATSTSVSWGAIIAGAVVASAFSLALLALGAGIGLISVSPWSNSNPSITTFGVLAAAWLIAVQLFASGLGGYLAGRLRADWGETHADEVYFRDTLHGLLVWALGAVISASLLASAASSIASGAASLAAGAAHIGAATAQAGAVASAATPRTGRPSAGPGAMTGYFTDMLFRADHATAADPAGNAEAGRILAVSAASGEMSNADKGYLSQLVAARTGLSQPDADKRVADVVAQAKSAKDKAAATAKTVADAARKTGVYVALWAFVSLLVGAFSASYMAMVGGRVREESEMAG